MKRFLRFNKKIVLGFLLLFFLIVSIGYLARPAYGYVEDTKETMNSDPVVFTPQVTIPGSDFRQGKDYKLEASSGPIARYISAIYNYGVGIVGIVAAMMLMIGGIIWLTAAGSSSKIEQAKSFIGSSLTGMALVFTAYILLNTINPDLVNLKTNPVTKLEELQCCQKADAAVMTYPASCRASSTNGVVYNFDYLVSADNKTCQKGGCCITSSVPASLVGAISTAFSKDSMSGSSLTYKTAFQENCSTGMEFPTAAVLTAGLFGSQTIVFYVNATCSEVRKETCAGKAEGDVCLGSTRYGFCYGGHCIAGEGERGDGCGNEGGSICLEDTNPCSRDRFGGLGCIDGLHCCLGPGATTTPATTCNTSNDRKSCYVYGSTNYGYCVSGTCVSCRKYGEGCVDDDQCPNQTYNSDSNPRQQCGEDANGNDGDCRDTGGCHYND